MIDMRVTHSQGCHFNLPQQPPGCHRSQKPGIHYLAPVCSLIPQQGQLVQGERGTLRGPTLAPQQ
eukprot:6491799-Amphidinium_carterae.1